MKSHLAQWTTEDVTDVLASRPREGRGIDYKRELSISRGDDVKDFLADVSAFANASGGVILFGIEEENGEPTACIGIEIDDSDATIRRVESIITDNLDPALRGCHCDVITIEDGKKVLVLRIPQSPAAPHMIKKGSPKFYTRGAAGNVPMDTYDLRAAFLASESMVEKTRRFVADRCEAVASRRLPFQLNSVGHAVMHIIPASAVLRPFSVGVKELQSAAAELRPPMHPGGWSPGICLEGITSTTRDEHGDCFSHVLFFRDGSVEASCPCRGDGSRSGLVYEERWLRAFSSEAPRYEQAITNLGVEPPFFISLSLIDCDETVPWVPPEFGSGAAYPITEKILHLPMLEWVDSPVDWTAVLRHFSDLYANRSGRVHSLYFNPVTGELRLRT